MKRQKKSIIRMNTRSRYIMLLLAAGMLGGCGEEKKEASEQEGVQTVLPSSSNEVTVTTLKKKVFEHQLVSNGKITATEYADLTFGTQFRNRCPCRPRNPTVRKAGIQTRLAVSLSPPLPVCIR